MIEFKALNEDDLRLYGVIRETEELRSNLSEETWRLLVLYNMVLLLLRFNEQDWDLIFEKLKEKANTLRQITELVEPLVKEKEDVFSWA